MPWCLLAKIQSHQEWTEGCSLSHEVDEATLRQPQESASFKRSIRKPQGLEQLFSGTNRLDLGSGIGSVGLLTLFNLEPDVRLLGIEAQEVSVGLARSTVPFPGRR